jgi:hypothetical protein
MKGVATKSAALGILVSTVLATPCPASARTIQCGGLPQQDIYKIAGPSCSTAKAVAKAHERQLLTPGGGGKHYVNADGKRWHLTWRFRNVPVRVDGMTFTQIEYYRATASGQVVTFQTYGAN